MTAGSQIEWSEIEDAASKMFAVWRDGSELVWAKECWTHFSAAGLTAANSEMERTAALLRLVALARIYHEFSGLAWDEDPGMPLDYLAGNLDIDPVALGILAGRTNKGDPEDAQDEHELRDVALATVTDAFRPEIFACLSKAYGNAIALYSRMWRTNPSAGEIHDQDEFEVTGPNAAALEYVTHGFRK